MREEFRGYFRPSDEELRSLWDQAIFTFDANVLLNLYRYSSETVAKFIDILTTLRGENRIWICHQAALEYHRNRCLVITEQMAAFDSIRSKLSSILDKPLDDLEQALRGFARHPSKTPQTYVTRLREAVRGVLQDIGKLQDIHPDLLADDPQLATVWQLFDARFGSPLDDSEMEKLRKEGKGRYERKEPPGYLDAEKQGDLKWGDLVIWRQLIDHAMAEKQPMVFVTDDRKADWWWMASDRVVGPRPELIAEFWQGTKQSFYMYTPESFLREAERYLERPDLSKAIEEVREVAANDKGVQRRAEPAEYRPGHIVQSVRWIDDGLSSYIGGGAIATGPLCPDDFATLLFRPLLRGGMAIKGAPLEAVRWEHFPDGVRGELVCPSCQNVFHLDGNVEQAAQAAGADIDGERRRKRFGLS